MSILMTPRIALKALGRNKLRTSLTMLGMIIGVAAVITMVALGTGAQSQIEKQGAPRHEHDRGELRQLVDRGVRQGQGMSTSSPSKMRRHRRAAGRSACLAGRQYTQPGHRRQPELVHADRGDRRGHAADPLLADDGWKLLHASGRLERREGRRARLGRGRHAVRRGVDPTGQVIRIRNQPFALPA